jgi:hypothetical protein
VLAKCISKGGVSILLSVTNTMITSQIDSNIRFLQEEWGLSCAIMLERGN